jgi:hypothetical protein
MKSHVAVAGNFIDGLWTGANYPGPMERKAVSILLEDLLRNHYAEWGRLVAMLLYGLSGNERATSFVLDWVIGHFLPWDVLEKSVRSLRNDAGRPRVGEFVRGWRRRRSLRSRLLMTT